MNQLFVLLSVTFLVVFGAIFGVYWILAVQPARSAHDALSRRLRRQNMPTEARAALLKDAARMSAIPLLNTLLGQRKASVVSLQRMIDQSGLKITVGTVLLSSVCLGLLAFAIVWWFSASLLLALGPGILASALPFLYVRRARDKRTRKFEELFPEAIDLIARSLRAGHAFTTGLAMVADEVPDPVGKEFRLLYDQQNYGMPLPDALRSFGDRVPLLDAKFFVTAVLTQRDAGGNLSEVLDNLSSVIRDRFKVKREVRARSAHGRLTGWILAGLPPSLAVALYLASPEWMSSLWKDPIGIRMVLAGIAFQVIGSLIIRKIVDIEY